MSSPRVARYAAWAVAAGAAVSLRSKLRRLSYEQAGIERAVTACSRRIGALEGRRLVGAAEPRGRRGGDGVAAVRRSASPLATGQGHVGGPRPSRRPRCC